MCVNQFNSILVGILFKSVRFFIPNKFLHLEEEMRNLFVLLVGIALLLSIVPMHGNAQGIPLSEADFSMLAKAMPEECFDGVGSTPGIPPCSDGHSKTNDAYIWSMTKSDPEHIWFGTNANTLCEVFGTYLGYTQPIITDDFVCEFAKGPYGERWGATTGDWRPPQIFKYNIKTSELTNVTSLIPESITTNTLGWRACTTFGNFVFFAGVARPINPTLPGFINMAVFNARSGQHVASTMLPPYTDIRQFLVASDGNLYCGVQRIDATPNGPLGSGRVLKWIGNPSLPQFPFAFEEVGILDGAPANITEYNNRIWATTWPLWLLTPDLKPWGVYRSPALPVGGLTNSNLSQWEKVWSYTMYDKDPLNGILAMGGDLKEHNGWLYFGSMHIPLMQVVVGQDRGATDTLDLVVNGHRAISVFRLEEEPGPSPRKVNVECLWGRKELAVFDPITKYYGENKAPTGYTPLFGDSGFGNIFNNYTWSMAEYNGWLYIGTMDWSYLVESVVEEYLKTMPVSMFNLNAIFDIMDNSWSFPLPSPLKRGILALVQKQSKDKESKDNLRLPPMPDFDKIMPGFDLVATNGDEWYTITNDGFGEQLSANYLNYGLRNMVADESSLYVGTANQMNLHEYGGWELWRGSSYCSLGSLKTDRIIYTCDTEFRPMEITLTDCDLDTTDTIEKVFVYISSKTENKEEPTTLTETAIDSGIFYGTVIFTETPTLFGDGKIMVTDNDEVTIKYYDAKANSYGAALIKKVVPVDCEPPVISNVRVEPVYQRAGIQPSLYGAVVRFNTKEHTFASVMYGLDCRNLWDNATDFVDMKEHAIFLRDLDQSTTYAFSIHVGDIAGNYSMDDNNGECHQFVTPPACEHNNIAFDNVIYGCDMGVFVVMHDCASNIDQNGVDVKDVFIHVVNPTNHEILSSETLTLTESITWPGVFEGSFMLSPDPDIPGDQIVHSIHGMRLVATKVPDGISTPTQALAMIDCQPPVISNLKVSNITETSALITFQTDEPANSSIGAGATCGNNTAFGGGAPPDMLNHEILLEFLSPGTTYYYDIMVQDLTMINSRFDNNNGECYKFTTLKGCSDGSIGFPQKRYACADQAFIMVRDCGADESSTTIETLLVNIVSDTEPTGEDVILTETGENTGEFTAFIQLAEKSAAGDGILTVKNADTIVATYHDPDDGTGASKDATASATIDCEGPQMLGMDIVQVTNNWALLQISTSEPATVQIDFSTTCGVTQFVVSSNEFKTIHTLLIPNLESGTRYFFMVTMSDVLGNVTYDENNGNCYTFMTRSKDQFNIWMLSDSEQKPRHITAQHLDRSKEF